MKPRPDRGSTLLVRRRNVALLHAPLLLQLLSPTASVAGPLSRATDRLPEAPPPPQGEAQWIASSMRMNGLPMTLKGFRSTLAPDDILQYYESWSRKLPRAQTRRSANPPWRILAIESQCCYVTVLVQATLGGSEGTLTVSPPLARAQLRLDTRFPRPQGARLANLQQYEDFGVESEHIALTSPRSVAAEAHAYAQLLRRDGWTLLREQRSTSDARGRIIEAQKGAEHALLTFFPDRASTANTAVVVVWRKS